MTARKRVSSQKGTVLLLIERRGSALRRLLGQAGYLVFESFTTDHAVAVCVNNPIDAVILDQDCFIETEGWSVAQSVKAAKPNLCVLLVSRARRISKRLPKGIDAISAADKPSELLVVLERLITRSASARTSKIIQSKHPVTLAQWFKGVDSPRS